MINYEIVKASPKQLFMQVRYYLEGNPDYWKNFVVTDFSNENVQNVAKEGSVSAQKFWQEINDQPEEIAITTTGLAKTIINMPFPAYDNASEFVQPVVTEDETTITNGWVVKSIINEPTPEYDVFTQHLEKIQTETNTQVINGWVVIDKTSQEIADYLADWRFSTTITMRQTRLALLQQDLLSSIDAAIAALPDPDKSLVSIEWEYAAVVERRSPWVIAMSTALGLTDVQLDDLFKLAATL